jgi:quinol monooxygenase YgiN
MIHVIATIKTIDDKRDELVAAFQEILPRIRAKTGCIEYGVAIHCKSGLPGQNPFDENEVIIIEKWTDLSALKTHITDPIYQTWFIKISPLIVGAFMEIFESVD